MPWPIRYAELEPWYAQAERVFGVHGKAGDDPTEPPRSSDFPHPPIPHEPVIGEVFERMRARGLHPSHMPAAIDFHPGGTCIRCGTCDAFPCKIGAKGDAETRLIDPALKHPNVRLQTGSLVTRLLTDERGKRIVGVEVERGGERSTIRARLFVLSAGAINSAAILLRSADSKNPAGLANSAGVVGRYYMNHNCTAILAVTPWRQNHTRYPKTLTLNDYYFGGDASDRPLGNLQLLGKIQEPMLRGALPNAPKWSRAWLARHSVDWYVMSEDLAQADSCVRLRQRRRDPARLEAQQSARTPALGRGGKEASQGRRLPDRAVQAVRHRHPVAPVRHGALRHGSRDARRSTRTAAPGITTTSTWWMRASSPPPPR